MRPELCMYRFSSEGIRWSKRILFGLNYGVTVGDCKNKHDHVLALSSTNLLSMHEKETACFLPDWPYTYTSGEGKGLREGPGLVG